MTSQYVIIVGITLIVSVLIVLVFIFGNTQIRVNHELNLRDLMERYNLNDYQIANRLNGLDTYDFLRYNLKEALWVQDEINTET